MEGSGISCHFHIVFLYIWWNKNTNVEAMTYKLTQSIPTCNANSSLRFYTIASLNSVLLEHPFLFSGLHTSVSWQQPVILTMTCSWVSDSKVTYSLHVSAHLKHLKQPDLPSIHTYELKVASICNCETICLLL